MQILHNFAHHAGQQLVARGVGVDVKAQGVVEVGVAGVGILFVKDSLDVGNLRVGILQSCYYVSGGVVQHNDAIFKGVGDAADIYIEHR